MTGKEAIISTNTEEGQNMPYAEDKKFKKLAEYLKKKIGNRNIFFWFTDVYGSFHWKYWYPPYSDFINSVICIKKDLIRIR